MALHCPLLRHARSALNKDRVHATCKRQVPGREILLFGPDEQQRELPVSDCGY